MAPAYWILIAVLAGFAGVILWVVVVSLGSGKRKREAKAREAAAVAAVIARHGLDEAFVNLDADLFVGFATADGRLVTGDPAGDAETRRLDQISKVTVELGRPEESRLAALADSLSLGEPAPMTGDPNRAASISLRINMAGEAEPLIIPFYDEKTSYIYLNIDEERSAEAKRFHALLNAARKA